LVRKPDRPSLLYRLIQVFTLTSHIPVIEPTYLDVCPADFNNILWQRIRKQWLKPRLKPSSNSLRCATVSIGVFTRPIMDAKIYNLN
jgi:hypothetical protein